LLIHGSADQTVPVQQSQRMAAALAERGRCVRLLEATGSPHFAMNGPTALPEQVGTNAATNNVQQEASTNWTLHCRVALALARPQCAPHPERFASAAAVSRAAGMPAGTGLPCAVIQQAAEPVKQFIFEEEVIR
jgi:hypothetical protein